MEADVNMSTMKGIIKRVAIVAGLLLLAALGLLRWMAAHMIVKGPLDWRG